MTPDCSPAEVLAYLEGDPVFKCLATVYGNFSGQRLMSILRSDVGSTFQGPGHAEKLQRNAAYSLLHVLHPDILPVPADFGMCSL